MSDRPKRKHRLGWQDEGLAQLVSCEGVELPGDPIVSTDSAEFDVCPRCGDTLKLVWNVYVEEVPRG